METTKKAIDFLEKQYAYEKERLRSYGNGCSMGKCAQSRIHLIDEIFKILKEGDTNGMGK